MHQDDDPQHSRTVHRAAGSKVAISFVASSGRRHQGPEPPRYLHGGFQRLRALFESPYKKDHSILGSMFWGQLFLETSTRTV